MNQPLLDYFKKYLLKKTPRSTTPGVKEVNIPGMESSNIPGMKLPGVNLSPASIKNYVSDVSLFLNWLSRSLQKDSLMAENITPANVNAYQKHLLEKINPATAQRHLSSLRCFGQFLLTTNRLNLDPTKDLINPAPIPDTWPQVIQQYTDFLKRENLSTSTIKNYVSDLNNYLAWSQTHSRNGIFKHSGNGIIAQKGQTLTPEKHSRSERKNTPGVEDVHTPGVKYEILTDNNLNNRSIN